MVVMRGLAANDTAERHIAVEPIVRPGDKTNRSRYLERARDLDDFVAGTGGGQRLLRPAPQQSGDMGIIGRFDDEDMGGLGHSVAPDRAAGVGKAALGKAGAAAPRSRATYRAIMSISRFICRPGWASLKVVQASVCGMMLTPNRLPDTSLTVRLTPSSVTEPLVATNGISC